MLNILLRHRHNLALVCLLPLLISSGCARLERPTPEQLTNADYGKPPEHVQELITNYLMTRLFDPLGAQYQLEEPIKGYFNQSSISGGRVVAYGYIVKGMINAKNRFGGFVGFSDYVFFIRDNIVYGTCVEAASTYLCRQDGLYARKQ